MPTLPFPSIVNLALVPTAVEEAILNLFASAVSMPIVQPLVPFAGSLLFLTVNPRAGVVVEVRVRILLGVEVPMPKLFDEAFQKKLELSCAKKPLGSTYKTEPEVPPVTSAPISGLPTFFQEEPL